MPTFQLLSDGGWGILEDDPVRLILWKLKYVHRVVLDDRNKLIGSVIMKVSLAQHGLTHRLIIEVAVILYCCLSTFG